MATRAVFGRELRERGCRVLFETSTRCRWASCAHVHDDHASSRGSARLRTNSDSGGDAGTLICEAAGFDVGGTSSAGIATALNLPDWKHLSRDAMLVGIDRITHNVTIPLSPDIEAGFGADAVAETVRRTIDAGAVGINLVDGTNGTASSHIPCEVHAETFQANLAAVANAGCRR